MRQSGPCFARTCCGVVVQEHDLRATPAQCNSKRALSSHFTVHASHPALHTSHSTLHLISNHVSSSHLTSPHLSSSHLIPSLLTCRLSQALLNCFHLIRALINLSGLLEVLLNSSQLFCTPEGSYCQREVSFTKNHWAQKAFAHRSLDTDAFTQKSLCKILCATKLAQGTSQYYVVLQSLQRARPRTTSYYKACTKHFPVLQSLHKYYCALHRLHKHFLVHCAQSFYTSTSFYTQQAFTQGHFYTGKLLHTEKVLHTESFTHSKFLHRENFYIHKENC